jgi:hypothetical protein
LGLDDYADDGGVEPLYGTVSLETTKRFNILFESCLSTAGQALDDESIILANLPEPIRAEFFELFQPKPSVLHKAEMLRGLRNATEAFISGKNRCRKINELRNACVRIALHNLYSHDVVFSEQEENQVRADVLAVTESEKKFIDPADCETSSPRPAGRPGLLRSNSTGSEEVSGGGRSELQEHLDEASSALLARVVESLRLGWDQQATLLFSINRRVCGELRRNFTVQDLAEMYLQSKLKRAFVALREAQLGLQGRLAERLTYRVVVGRVVRGDVRVDRRIPKFVVGAVEDPDQVVTPLA